MVVSSRKKEFEIWARRFIRELGACETIAEWGELIAENGVHLGECSAHNPSEYVTVKMAIKSHSERIERKCLATTFNASTAKETDANTHSMSTETAPK